MNVELKLVGSDEPDAMQKARERLAAACFKQPMDPTQAAISAYITSIMTAARVNALCELFVHPPTDELTREAAIEAAILKAMNEAAEAIETQAASASRIQVASGLNGLKSN